ncbi:MAG: hypothetical protein VR64_20450 [Desulfatitalea sp. BRH_c12]|nr:MAG: hypothetical protein VR64_20450 [Desulfatitalea sp. BRH_c12]
MAGLPKIDEALRKIGKKVTGYGAKIINKLIVTDDPDAIANAVRQAASQGCNIILLTGGLSVDPDDVTRKGIEQSGAEIRVYAHRYFLAPCFCMPN